VAVGARTVAWLYRKDPGLLAERSWLLLFRSFADNTFGSALVLVGGSLVTGAGPALAVGLALSLLAVRSRDEEALLTRELAGYDEYRRRVRSRLIPFVW
jgi:protein-S-isoprenylcysteine O-methyltransferase Ste14